MNPIRNAARAALAAATLTALAACSPEAGTPAREAASPDAAGLTVSNPRIVLSPVAGNPAAVYFDLAWTGAAGVALTAVTLEGAGMTMIHDYAEQGGKRAMVMAETVALAPGTPVSFAPGGLHVMAMDVTDALAPGRSAKVTLTLSNGTSTTLDVPVRAAGDER